AAVWLTVSEFFTAVCQKSTVHQRFVRRANLYEDIQSAGSDTCPPMLDRSDFKSWQQRIHLYYLGKENGENILQSINEGPLKMGKF
ncbi:hypothetical protein Tco_1013556, partial [Tanacetum coccineum]